MQKLTKEQQKIIEDNIGLLYAYYKNQLITEQTAILYYRNKVLSDLQYRLCLCVIGFDVNKNVKFSTYVYRSFHNSIINHLKKIIKWRQTLSYPDNIFEDDYFSFDIPINKEPSLKFDWNFLEELIKKEDFIEEDRQIFELHYGRGISYSGLAKLYPMGRESIRKRVVKIFNHIQAIILSRGYELDDLILKS